MAGTSILDSSGRPMMADSVTEAINLAGSGQRFAGPGFMERMFSPELAYAAYLSSGLLQKVIEIPASDRVREWRDWQAEKPQIEAIEAEERRLGLIAKVRQAEVLRGICGGALILVTKGPRDTAYMATPLDPDTVKAGDLVAVNVVTRRQISAVSYVGELASPDYGMPTMWKLGGTETLIHPSRVVCFRGDPLPAGLGQSEEDVFWGQIRLHRIWKEVERSDRAQTWFAELVKKAKLLRIGIPGLTDFTSTAQGQERLNRRMSAIALGEGILNATVYDAGSGTDKTAETITDFTMSWNGIPAMMDAFDQRVSAVSDIPFTRLMGRSPAGMNATGQYDDISWSKTVQAGQQLETRPCLEQLDPILLRSAGITDTDKVWWKWAPLWSPTEKETADTFKVEMEAVTALQATGSIPEVAFNKGVQNLMSERQYLPGLDQALSEIPEDERFGLSPDDDGSDPSALTSEQQGGGDPVSLVAAGGASIAPARRAANDAKPIPLYVQRKLLNADELIRWAKAQGFKTTLDASDMHATVLYSRTPVDPIKMGEGWSSDQDGNLTVPRGGPRAVEKLGESAVVLLFASYSLVGRHRQMIEEGASHDFDEYQPHVTLTYEAGDVDLEKIKPFTGELRFGPELFEPLDLDWKQKLTEE